MTNADISLTSSHLLSEKVVNPYPLEEPLVGLPRAPLYVDVHSERFAQDRLGRYAFRLMVASSVVAFLAATAWVILFVFLTLILFMPVLLTHPEETALFNLPFVFVLGLSGLGFIAGWGCSVVGLLRRRTDDGERVPRKLSLVMFLVGFGVISLGAILLLLSGLGW